MSSFLTPFQQAVLQEMGIPVWVDNQVVKNTTGTPVTDVTSPREVTSGSETSGSERIAQLRAVLGTKTTSVSPQQATTDGHIKQESQSATLYDKPSLGAMEADILGAIAYCRVSVSEKWLQGQQVEIADGNLSLPVKVTIEDKKQLWQKLISLSRQ